MPRSDSQAMDAWIRRAAGRAPAGPDPPPGAAPAPSSGVGSADGGARGASMGAARDMNAWIRAAARGEPYDDL